VFGVEHQLIELSSPEVTSDRIDIGEYAVDQLGAGFEQSFVLIRYV
jgi:hypothetical protein